MLVRLRGLASLVLVFAFVPAALGADEPFRFPEGKEGKGELKYINGLPVLHLEGTPEEIGTQMARLTAKHSVKLLNYPRNFLKLFDAEFTWPAILAAGRGLLANFPPDHLKELETGIKASGLDRDLFIAANTMFDVKKVIGCSVLMLDAERSATGKPLFGRNLDFPTLGYLQDYSLVVICCPEGKHPFVSVGFPGMIGVLSGMNDAGLTLAVLEVYSTCEDSPRFDPKGTPYAICFRRLLEECTTVDEAEKLLRSMHRTTRINLAICDTKQSAVFEITPRSVVVRKGTEGICPCTNHFRTRELANGCDCNRYDNLEKSRTMRKLDLPDLQKKLDSANQGWLTLQTMIFEPATLKLHLALGKPPTSALPMKTLDLGPMLAKEKK